MHRLARQFARDFVGRRVAASSPQGRFAAGAALIDGRELRAVRAVGKQLFLDFGEPGAPGPWLRTHLGMYGAWDFYGRVSPISADQPAYGSIGAPRLRRAVRIAEYETLLAPGTGTGTAPGTGYEDGVLPAPVGQVRLRLVAGADGPGWTLADLRGPSACEVIDGPAVERVIAALGPDPADQDGPDAERRFVTAAARRAVPIGRLLMDQSVVSGIGNVYRAELLFRAGLDPYRPGRAVGEEALTGLWRDWAVLLRRGIDTGVMLTRDGLTEEQLARAREHPEERHWVYRRQGEPCRACGTPIAMELLDQRKLYRCPACQV